MSIFHQGVWERLHKMASEKAKQFPQYRGHFDGWVLGEMEATVGGYKGGSVFAQRQLVLCKPKDLPPGDVFGVSDISVYDPTLDHECSMPRYQVRVIYTPSAFWEKQRRWAERLLRKQVKERHAQEQAQMDRDDEPVDLKGPADER